MLVLPSLEAILASRVGKLRLVGWIGEYVTASSSYCRFRADQSFRRSTDAVVKRLVVAATDSREKSPPEGRDLLVAATS